MILLSTQTEVGKTITPVKYVPEISMILPFQPLLFAKSLLEQQIRDALAKVEAQLMSAYTMQQAMPVFMKLQKVISTLNFYTHKKSVALFISPVIEKVFYMGFDVEERVLVDTPFKLTDIAHVKKQHKQFLLLLLGKDASHVYVGNPAGLHLIMLNKNINKTMGTQSGVDSVNEIKSFTNFLVQVDKGLGIVMKTHPYPVFIVGNDKLINWYQSITQNEEHISRCLQQPHPFPDEEMLHKLITPYFHNWTQITNQRLIKQLNKAHQQQQLIYGFAACHKATKEKGSLLVLEDGHCYPEVNADNNDTVNPARLFNKPFYLQNSVDEIAERVLESGGDLELLPEGSLARYHHIAYLNRI
jgi:hypothetical protein